MVKCEETIKTAKLRVEDLKTESRDIKTEIATKEATLKKELEARALGESFSATYIDKLRVDIEQLKRRYSEVQDTILALNDRCVVEEAKLKQIKKEALMKELKCLDLDFYRTYREKLIHAKALRVSGQTLQNLNTQLSEILAKIGAIDSTALVSSSIPGTWFEEGTEVEKNLKKYGNILPWDDVEDLCGGEQFLKREIAKFETEIK